MKTSVRAASPARSAPSSTKRPSIRSTAPSSASPRSTRPSPSPRPRKNISCPRSPTSSAKRANSSPTNAVAPSLNSQKCKSQAASFMIETCGSTSRTLVSLPVRGAVDTGTAHNPDQRGTHAKLHPRRCHHARRSHHRRPGGRPARFHPCERQRNSSESRGTHRHGCGRRVRRQAWLPREQPRLSLTRESHRRHEALHHELCCLSRRARQEALYSRQLLLSSAPTTRPGSPRRSRLAQLLRHPQRDPLHR